MLERLRTATQSAHLNLERSLDLLGPPLSRSRFIGVLGGFEAFHRDWEPRVEVLIDDAALLAPRRKLHLIEQDLRALALGGSRSQIAFDLGFLSTPSAAWGSLYVMEGSSLGGMVISHALRAAPWAPPRGLTYFAPYGRQTAQMWASFGAALERAAERLDEEAVIDGAQLTFATLERGLCTQVDAAA